MKDLIIGAYELAANEGKRQDVINLEGLTENSIFSVGGNLLRGFLPVSTSS
jgi:hypothetical protein